MFHNNLTIKENLVWWHITQDSMRFICDKEVKILNHIFIAHEWVQKA